MNTMSNNWKPELLSSGKVEEGSLYSASRSDIGHEDLAAHIADKKTQQIGRMVEAMVILFVLGIVAFTAYKVYLSFR